MNCNWRSQWSYFIICFYFNLILTSYLSFSQLPPHNHSTHRPASSIISTHRCVGDYGYVHPSFHRNHPNVDVWKDYSQVSCSLQNVCIRADQTGNFFPDEVVTLLYYLGDDRNSPFPPNFRTGRLKFDASNAHVHIRTVNKYFPQIEPDVKILSGLFSDWCTYNLGHYLLEAIFPHYVMNLKFGFGERYDFQLVSTNPVHPKSMDFSFGESFSKHRITSLQTLAKQKNVSNHTLCFANLNIGMIVSLRTQMYADTTFSYQQYLLKNMGYPLKKKSAGNRVVMGSKGGINPGVNEHVGGRHFYNPQEMNKTLNDRFSNFRLEEFATLPAREQIELMQDTAVFVTPGGGISFIGMFLPIGSVIITLDYYDYGLNISQPFATENHFWNNCNWIKVWRYPVTPEEYYCQDGVDFCRQKYHLGNYKLDLDRLSHIIDLALVESKSGFPSPHFEESLLL